MARSSLFVASLFAALATDLLVCATSPESCTRLDDDVGVVDEDDAPGIMLLQTGVKTEPAQEPSYPWACKNGDALRTGASSFTVSSIESGPTWSFHEDVHIPEPALAESAFFTLRGTNLDPNLKSLIRAAPLIDDNRNIYLATVTSGNIYKFSPDGHQLWRHSASGGTLLNGLPNDNFSIPDIPAIMGGRLFAATADASVFALDMETGSKLWSTKAGPRSAGDTWAIAAAEGVVIAAVSTTSSLSANNNRLVAMRASDGQIKWTFDTDGDIYNVLVSIKDGSCVFSTSAGKVYRLSLDTGSLLWDTPLPAIPDFSTGGSIVGPNGIVYTTWNEFRCATGMCTNFTGYASTGMVGAYDWESGRKLWESSIGLQANNAASVGRLADGQLGLIIGAGTNPMFPDPRHGITDGVGPHAFKQQVISLDATTGQVRWRYHLPDYHGAALGDTHRYDICLPDAFGNAAIGGDGAAYIGHASGFLHRIEDSNSDGLISASEVTTWQAGAAFQGTPAIAQNMLVATPCNGMHVWKT